MAGVIPGNYSPELPGNDATQDPMIYGQKGDLRVYNTTTLKFERLPVGTNGQILTLDSSTALGIKWA
jgi:hypothetical protein